MSLEPNTRLGPYEILGLLGAGGMGEVYKGRDTRLGRLVAIKVTTKHLDGRFEREARSISALNHPNICTLYDVGPNYLVMELVEGETLAARLRGGPIALDQVVRLATEIADALAEAHGLGMIHRDLKPANIMITTSGRVKLLDFGLAKLMQDPDPDATLTVEGAVLGTFAYMSPEQLQGKPADPRSDVFAFGAVLYEMLSGQRAFATAVLRDEPKSLVGVPYEASLIVARCLSKNPNERYARIVDVKSALERIAASKPAGDGPSIAVLPFANMSADKENEYFSDGLAEEILNALTRVPGLKVTARTSAFAFRGKEQDIRRIGEALDVKTVLEGSVRRAGNRIRVTAQLINVSNGYHLWSERYDREMDDVFAVQDEISQAIVETLKVRLGGTPLAPIRHTPNIEAYHAYLKGHHHLFKVTPDDLALSRRYFEQAIAIDPLYGAAYGGLGACFGTMIMAGGKPAREMVPLAKAALLKAVELDETDSETQEGLARMAGVFEYDWTEALRRCRMALACERVSSEARAGCAQFTLYPLGRLDEAMAALQPALSADPLSPLPRLVLAALLARRRAYEPAIEELRRVIEQQPGLFMPYAVLGGVYTGMKRTQEAIATLERGLEIAPWAGGLMGMLAGNYILAGDPRAESMVARLDASGSDRLVGRACFHVICSELDRAANVVEETIESRLPNVPLVIFGPVFDSLRNTPRGQALLEKMNLKDISP